MARCPVCGHDVRTPFFLNLNDWAQLACPACKARLEMKPPRSALLALIADLVVVLARGGLGFYVFRLHSMFDNYGRGVNPSGYVECQ